jgi:hypothetical protein
MPKWFSPRVSTTTRTTNSLVTSTGLAGPAVSETLCGSVRSLSNQRLSQNGSPLNSSPGITTVCVTSSHRFSCFSASKLSANIPRPPGSLQLLPVPMRFAYSADPFFIRLLCRYDSSDLHQLMSFFVGFKKTGLGSHDEEARKIAEQGKAFVERHWRK